MKRGRSPIAIICLLGLLAGNVHSFAQDKKPEKRSDLKGDLKQGLDANKLALSQAKPTPKKPGVEGTFRFLGSKFSFGKPVKGAPYSATAITESTQTLSDGNQIIRKNEAAIYRDTEGRSRIDQRLETIGKWAANGEPRLMTLINDPVAGVSYSLDPSTLTAHKNVYGPSKPAPPRSGTLMINGQPVTQAEFEAAKEKKRRDQEELRKQGPSGLEPKMKPDPPQPRKVESDQRKTESLGTQIIEGVTAEGTRSTLTIPAGEIGNVLPLEIVDETWYSPELQLQVMTKHHDPRSGAVLYRLTNLNRSEPDRSLFEVPVGYTVNEGSVSEAKKKPEGPRQ